MAYFYGAIMYILAYIDNQNGNALSADIQAAAGAICFAIGSIKQKRVR